MKLDYTIKDPAERIKYLNKILQDTPSQKLTKHYLDILSDYLVMAMDSQEKKSRQITTANRMVTVNKREMSFNGLAEQFENGEDGIYNLITNDKNIIFMPKVEITAADVSEIPGLSALRQTIAALEEKEKGARGRSRYILKKTIIDLRKDQYILKNSYRHPIYLTGLSQSASQLVLDEKITVSPTGELDIQGVSLLKPQVVSALLCNYEQLKTKSFGKFDSDITFLLMDLENLINHTLKIDYPYYYDLLWLKVYDYSNPEIAAWLEQKHHITHTVEYISSLWRNKIPKLLAAQAQKDYLIWYYTFVEYGHWKKCSRCHEIKLAHPFFFSKNGSSKDGYYSICKECRNKKGDKK